MMSEEKSEEIFREPTNSSMNQKQRCFNTVISDAITLESSFLGLNELLAFDSFMN